MLGLHLLYSDLSYHCEFVCMGSGTGLIRLQCLLSFSKVLPMWKISTVLFLKMWSLKEGFSEVLQGGAPLFEASLSLSHSFCSFLLPSICTPPTPHFFFQDSFSVCVVQADCKLVILPQVPEFWNGISFLGGRG